MAREREEEHGDYGKHASLAGHGQVSHRDGAEVTLHHKEQANAAGFDGFVPAEDGTKLVSFLN